MDPLTHGLSGAVAAGAFVDPRHGRAARWALFLGSVFPDIDVIANPFDPDGMGTIRMHRAVTHSIACLPLWAIVLAVVVGGFWRWRGVPAPRRSVLALLFGSGIGLHILFDVITSFGTMVWSPINWTRVSLDWTFILDLALTAVLLYFLLVAWVAGGAQRSRSRAVWLLGLVALLTALYATGAYALGQPASPALFLIIAALAVLPLLGTLCPEARHFRPVTWCRAGVLAAAAYLALNAAAHERALARVQQEAAGQHWQVKDAAALPLPPNVNWWMGLVRTPDGVHVWRFALRETAADAVAAQFAPAVSGDPCPSALWQLSQVRAYLRFARFPVLECHRLPEGYMVEFHDLRFRRPPFRWQRASDDPRRTGFTWRVTLDVAGRLRSEEWVVF